MCKSRFHTLNRNRAKVQLLSLSGALPFDTRELPFEPARVQMAIWPGLAPAPVPAPAPDGLACETLRDDNYSIAVSAEGTS